MKPFLGILSDLRKRIPKYGSDWKDGLHVKVIGSIVFMFWTSIGPALTFGTQLSRETNQEIGTVEVLVSTAITGMLFALIGGQPLVIVGVTGPVTIFTITVYNLCDSFDVPFLPFMAWVCFWAGAMHMLMAVFNWCNMISLVTRYSCECFGVLIAIIYIYNAITDLVDYFDVADDCQLRASLCSLVLCFGTAYAALSLSKAEGWMYLTPHMRTFFADYAAALSIVVFTGVSYMGKLDDADVLRLSNVPESFGTSSSRDWLVELLPDDLSTGAIFAAIGPAAVLTVLFFFDHNVSSLLSQRPEFGLKKGTAYHWDFFVIGLMIIVCGLFGIPPVNGLIPQAPLHVRSLAKIKLQKFGNSVVEVYENVHETRLSGFVQALLIGVVAIAALPVIRWIPRAVLSGLFLYMGFSSFTGNSFSDRIKLLFKQAHMRNDAVPYVKLVPYREIVKFTLIQLGLWSLIFVDTLTPAAIAFPIFIVLLVPVRRYLLPKMFSQQYLQALDGGFTEDDGGHAPEERKHVTDQPEPTDVEMPTRNNIVKHTTDHEMEAEGDLSTPTHVRDTTSLHRRPSATHSMSISVSSSKSMTQ